MRKILFLLSFLMYLGINSQAQQTIATHTWNFDDPVVGNSVEGWDIINYANPNTSNGILNLTASTFLLGKEWGWNSLRFFNVHSRY